MSGGGLPLLLLAAPLAVGLVAWLWRRARGHRAGEPSTDTTDFSNATQPNWGTPWWSPDSDSPCNASETSSDGGGDGGCGGDGGGGD